MNAENYSLDKLQDIVIPNAPPFWPPAPGVWVALIVTIAIVLFMFIRLRAARQQNAYRRAGLDLLNNARTVYDVSVILKRVALVAFPREQVASLYGNEWAVFLNNRCKGCRFTEFAEYDVSREADQQLLKMANSWIRRHRAAELTRGG